MSLTNWIIILSFLLIPVILSIYRNQKISQKNERLLEKSEKWGRNIPSSLHPQIDLDKCIGCGACVEACPEKTVLGLIYGKAHLISASDCIGHGACKDACPSDAIELVLGTEKRGVDIPVLDHHYQTNIRGIYVAGELRGMGLVFNSIRQGARAVQYIAQDLKSSPDLSGKLPPNCLDLLIVGAGPAGISAALKAKELGLNFLLIEQEDSIGGAIAKFPRHKIIILSDYIEIPLAGKIRRNKIAKEEIIELFSNLIAKYSIPVEFNCPMRNVSREDGYFRIEAGDKNFFAQRVLLAIGRRGTPRKLGVPGEDNPNVFYSLREPEEFAGSRCTVVGGGDSAIETALALSEQPGTEVTLSYRGDKFWRAKQYNVDALEKAVQSGKIRLFLRSQVVEIRKDRVTLSLPDGTTSIPNDWVFVMIGGTLPNKLLRQLGIETTTVFGEKLSAS